MRIKRLYKFKKLRHRKIRLFLGYGLFLPSLLIVAGYVISLLFILPLLNK